MILGGCGRECALGTPSGRTRAPENAQSGPHEDLHLQRHTASRVTCQRSPTSALVNSNSNSKQPQTIYIHTIIPFYTDTTIQHITMAEQPKEELHVQGGEEPQAEGAAQEGGSDEAAAAPEEKKGGLGISLLPLLT